MLHLKSVPHSKHTPSHYNNRQCTHNATFRRVRATIVVVEK